MTADIPPRPRAVSALDVTIAGPRSHVARLHESGALRLRLPRRSDPLEGVIINTGGGVLGGDKLDLSFDLQADAKAVLTTVAAEKIYRSEGEPGRIATHLALAPGTRLDWLPQETILFEAARLHRRLTIDMDASAHLLACEITVFGRLAMGEAAISGAFRDSWRLRRGGRLVFADESKIEGDMADIFDRPALGAKARASALIVKAAPEAEDQLDALREIFAGHTEVEAGASAFNGILVARALAGSPERLRAAIIAALAVLRDGALPRVWQS